MSNCARSTDGAAIYRKAASLIASGGNRRSDEDLNEYETRFQGACDVLACPYISYSFNEPDLRMEFHSMFVAEEGFLLVSDVMPDAEAQRWRVLALCFMAAMVEAGDA